MIDILFAIIVVAGVIKGIRRGIVVAIFSILAFVIGLAAALKLSSVTAEYLQKNITVGAKWLPILSFTLVFIAVTILVHWCAKLIEKTIEVAYLGWANKIAGAVFYVALYTFILSIVLFYAEKIDLLQPQTFDSSVTYQYIKPLGPLIIDNLGKIVPIFKGSFEKLEDFFEHLSDKIQH